MDDLCAGGVVDVDVGSGGVSVVGVCLRKPPSVDAPTLFNAHQKCLIFHPPQVVSNRLLSEV